MWKLEYTKDAFKQLSKLQKNIQKRIKEKLDFYLAT